MCEDNFDGGIDGWELGIMLAISEEMAEEERARIMEEQESGSIFPDYLDKDDIF